MRHGSHEQGIRGHVVMKVYPLNIEGMLSDDGQQGALCSLVLVAQPLFSDGWLVTWKNHLYHAAQQHQKKPNHFFWYLEVIRWLCGWEP